MMRNWFEYTLKVRVSRLRYGTLKAPKIKTVKVVARSRFDAEIAFKNHNPGMVVVGWERGAVVDPPPETR